MVAISQRFVALLMLALPLTASGLPITVQFEGLISGSTVTGAMPVGDRIQGYFTYDSSAADADLDPTIFRFDLTELYFDHALVGSYGNLGRLDSGTQSQSGSLIVDGDSISVRYSEADGALPPGSYLELGLDFEFLGAVVAPLPPIANFWDRRVSGGRFFFTVGDVSGFGRGDGLLTSVAVPEPSTLALLGLGLAGLGLARRRKLN